MRKRTPAADRHQYHAEPRNRPMRSQGYHEPPHGGHHPDWRHNAQQDRMGCYIMIAVSAPIVYWLGQSLHLW